MLKRALRFFCVAFASFLYAPSLGQQGIGVSPPRFELFLAPGEHERHTVTVFLKHTPEEVITPSVVDWSMDVYGNIRLLSKGQNPYSASNWIKVSLEPFRLSNQESYNIPFQLAIPRNAGLSGSYWTAIALTSETRSGTTDKGLHILFRTRVVVPVYVTIRGTERPDFVISSFIKREKDKGGYELIADIENTGNTYLRLKPQLRLKNSSGETIRTLPLPMRVLLRGSVIRYQIPDNVLPNDAVVAALEVSAKQLPSPRYAEVALR